MAEFYVDPNSNAEGFHLVHRNTCAQLPAAATLRYLGSYASREAAFSLANGYYRGVVYCPACLVK